MQKHQKALGRCNRQGSKHELDSAQQSLTNIIQKNPELVTLKISVYKIATATWLLRYWPICRRCCRVLAAKKQEQTWEISTWLSKHCQPVLKSCECHCLSHVMSWCVASKNACSLPMSSVTDLPEGLLSSRLSSSSSATIWFRTKQRTWRTSRSRITRNYPIEPRSHPHSISILTFDIPFPCDLHHFYGTVCVLFTGICARQPLHPFLPRLAWD